jgi:hypothetical protein
MKGIILLANLGHVLLVLGLLVSGSFAFPNSAVAENDYFGGQTVSFPVSPIPSSCQKIRAKLWQETSRIVAKADEVTLESCSSEVKVLIPIVRTKTSFSLEIELSTDTEWKSFGTIKLSAYPSDILKPLRVWAQRHPIEVEDSDGKLEAFLEQQKIPYQSKFRHTLKSPQAILRMGVNEIHFLEKIQTIPWVRINKNKISIEMMFLEELSVNPAYQFELLSLVKKNL